MDINVTDRILVIGDTHFPAVHQDYVAFLAAVRDEYGLDTALHVGDVVDFHAISYHESDPNLPSSGEELAGVRPMLAEFSAEFPELTICAGNHDKLPARKAKTLGLPKAMLRGFNEYLGTPDTWKWAPGYVSFNLACGMPCVMQHSISSSLAAGKNKLRTSSLIQGHYHHTAGVAWDNAPCWNLFFLSAGCGVDPHHPAMSYAGDGVLKLPALGCGVIVEGWASYVPMWQDDRGRWTGKVP